MKIKKCKILAEITGVYDVAQRALSSFANVVPVSHLYRSVELISFPDILKCLRVGEAGSRNCFVALTF